ncbi:hypothetical protein [Pseudomonas sp. 2(2015)]|uniref:hypothetical protein n=1 Tax=Pseudomonas sp. 2(2015) TaxID=1619950 RepID=UPI0015A5A014|nr:hypothetical protein [Pseudomonas sp. 2(2015)]
MSWLIGVSLAQAGDVTHQLNGSTGLAIERTNHMKPCCRLVLARASKIMAGEKEKQLSQIFDAPQYAQQVMELARKTGKCRDLRIRAKCEITDAEGETVINQ